MYHHNRPHKRDSYLFFVVIIVKCMQFIVLFLQYELYLYLCSNHYYTIMDLIYVDTQICHPERGYFTKGLSGSDWHCPANISVIYYMCNIKVKNI
jgi:hypothetical protein